MYRLNFKVPLKKIKEAFQVRVFHAEMIFSKSATTAILVGNEPAPAIPVGGGGEWA